MRLKNRMSSEPIPVVRQFREVRVRQTTTIKPGVIAPVAAFNLLRMDGCSGRVSIAVEMAETFEIQMNRSFVRASAWFLPHVALDRFQQSTAIFERSFAGEPMTKEEGAPVIPFIELAAHGTAGSNAVYKCLGLHAPAAANVNTSYLETYNQIVNYIRRNRSASLTERELDDATLAPAMWGESTFSDIVPDFDDAMIAGELPLSIVSGNLPITGSGDVALKPGTALVVGQNGDGSDPRVTRMKTDGDLKYNGAALGAEASLTFVGNLEVDVAQLAAELSTDGVTISLANIDQARQLVHWAKLRERYDMHKDPYIIDALLAGIKVEDQAWFQPMLLDQKLVQIEQIRRMATDGASLEEGVANGVAGCSLGINVPPNTFGGVVMIVLEAFPEQLYERQADPWFMAQNVDDLPNYFKDATNPMPVVEVLNGEVDVVHTAPAQMFGWARRNWKWAKWPTRVGGDLFAATPSAATTVARRSIWATDVADPELSEEFYVTSTLGREVFVDQVKDPFKVGLGGTISVSGLTVIGEVYESEANYDEVRAAAPPLQPIA